ncbi:MAG TPA: hypothetical protein VIT65_13850 [Microlunatus sp.]
MIPKIRLAYTDALRIRCDACQLDSYVFGMKDNTPEEVRRVASKSGWRWDGKQDICPHCAHVPVNAG